MPNIALVEGTVPSLSIILMGLGLALSVLIPIALIILLKKKYSCKISAFVWGLFTYFVCVVLLKSATYAIVGNLPVAATINGNPYLYAFFVAVVTVIFEEGGRMVAMKFLLKKKHKDNEYSSLMYGVGHGGFELLVVLIPTMVSSISVATMVNDGSFMEFLADIEDQDAINALITSANNMINENSWLYLLIIVERMAAVVIQLCLSVWVWQAARNRGAKWLYMAAGIHFGIIFISSALNQGLKLNLVVVEIIYIVMAAALAYITKKMFYPSAGGSKPSEDEQYLM